MERGLICQFGALGWLHMSAGYMSHLIISVSLPQGAAAQSEEVIFSEEKKEGVVVSIISGIP